jgi:hypothetical protein
VSYAVTRREVSPVEQHVHSFLEMIPLMAMLFVISLHWGQFQALFGFGSQTPRFDLAWKEEPLPAGYVLSIMAVILLFELIPYFEEFFRGLRANGGKIIPPKAAPHRMQENGSAGASKT